MTAMCAAEVISGVTAHRRSFHQRERLRAEGTERLLQFGGGELPQPRRVGIAVVGKELGALPPRCGQVAGAWGMVVSSHTPVVRCSAFIGQPGLD